MQEVRVAHQQWEVENKWRTARKAVDIVSWPPVSPRCSSCSTIREAGDRTSSGLVARCRTLGRRSDDGDRRCRYYSTSNMYALGDGDHCDLLDGRPSLTRTTGRILVVGPSLSGKTCFCDNFIHVAMGPSKPEVCLELFRTRKTECTQRYCVPEGTDGNNTTSTRPPRAGVPVQLLVRCESHLTAMFMQDRTCKIFEYKPTVLCGSPLSRRVVLVDFPRNTLLDDAIAIGKAAEPQLPLFVCMLRDARTLYHGPKLGPARLPGLFNFLFSPPKYEIDQAAIETLAAEIAQCSESAGFSPIVLLTHADRFAPRYWGTPQLEPVAQAVREAIRKHEINFELYCVGKACQWELPECAAQQCNHRYDDSSIGICDAIVRATTTLQVTR